MPMRRVERLRVICRDLLQDARLCAGVPRIDAVHAAGLSVGSECASRECGCMF